MVKTAFPLQGTWVRFLVGELRPHMLQRAGKREKKKKKETDLGNPLSKYGKFPLLFTSLI